jgi:hypothetical protein
MLIQIVLHTPLWVWAVLAALLAYGLAQTLPRRLARPRIAIVPLVLLVLSFAGVIGSFGWTAAPVLAWAIGVAAALVLGRGLVAQPAARWEASTARVHVPGSWLPLALMMGLFLTKYGVGVTLAIRPALGHDLAFDAAVGLAYGGFSGLFLARAAMLWRSVRGARSAAV